MPKFASGRKKGAQDATATTKRQPGQIEILTGPAIGKTLISLCKSGPAFVAVPFVSADAVRLLPLLKKSVLVACINAASARAGHVSPRDLVAMHRRGVQLFDNPHLHAKVYVFPRAAVIGSSNISKSSRYNLEEACVLIRKPDLVREARELVKRLATGSPLPEQYIASLPQREPAVYPPMRVPRSGQPQDASRKLLYVASSVEADYTDEQARVAESAHEEAGSRATRRLNFSTLLWPRDPGIRVGDEILIREDDDPRDIRIRPPGVVFSVKRWSSGAVMVAYAVDPGQRSRTKKRFSEIVSKSVAKYVLGPKNTFRKVPDSVREEILSPWKPWPAPLRGGK